MKCGAVIHIASWERVSVYVRFCLRREHYRGDLAEQLTEHPPSFEPADAAGVVRYGMTNARQTVLLTGFGPFPGVAENATASLVPGLAERAAEAFPAYHFITDILPTEWRAAPERLAALLARVRPMLVLHFGVARGLSALRIETQGLNTCRSEADGCGAPPIAAELEAEGTWARAVTIPTSDIVARLERAGLPVELSDDAGGYLCNAVLYHSLAHAGAADVPPATGFIHIPADLSKPPLTFEATLTGGLEIIRACLPTGGP